jgi:hypothetical protein
VARPFGRRRATNVGPVALVCLPARLWSATALGAATSVCPRTGRTQPSAPAQRTIEDQDPEQAIPWSLDEQRLASWGTGGRYGRHEVGVITQPRDLAGRDPMSRRPIRKHG